MKKNETDLDLNRNHLKNKWGLIEFSHYTATNTENFSMTLQCYSTSYLVKCIVKNTSNFHSKG